ncbi:S-adenosylmethionine decarboxylase [Cantharellus anzutake]|uniref:S-adenosylmethionine decarboxylase n=1 Tax=Cantharellus anzutake TaxID=1750568 RepID=UPI001904A579|nr:S-adenosylmethionine decarboxylase [Cantharellus anzutake]KAF8342309.1 S-adenosylmethionine decarboxylase [Cantharellus anzutake]
MEKSDAAADNPPAVLVTPDLDASCPFEGPEKLLEIWFHPAPLSADPQSGLRAIDRHDWENMLSVVKCKVLSMISGHEMDAYLLSESSFFVFPHKVILKTCGTTLNLLGLPRILEIAADGCGYRDVWRCFYSRKSFMFPERQHGPHREWKDEMDYLDNLFPKHNGAAYAVGKVNGDHWLLYLTTPPGDDQFSNPDEPYNLHTSSIESSQTLASPNENDPVMVSVDLDQDYTIELLMTKLAAPARRPFFFLDEDLKDFTPEQDSEGFTGVAQAKGAFVSSQLGISSIFPQHLTKLDSYAFEPCGYSANGIVSYGEETSNVGLATNGEGYYTIHVTPEEGWSYASFECNVPIMPADFHSPTAKNLAKDTKGNFPNLETLIQRVVDIFQPGP